MFSPSDKLLDVQHSSDLTRASVISVGDLNDLQALDFLRQTGCNATLAARAHLLINGHLPFLLLEPVKAFCMGVLSFQNLAEHITGLVRKDFMFVDKALKCNKGCACKAACAIRNKQWDYVGLDSALPLLLEQRLVRSSIAAHHEVIDSRFIQCYIQHECACNSKAAVTTPPCG